MFDNMLMSCVLFCFFTLFVPHSFFLWFHGNVVSAEAEHRYTLVLYIALSIIKQLYDEFVFIKPQTAEAKIKKNRNFPQRPVLLFLK
jgi:hypothetical protein